MIEYILNPQSVEALGWTLLHSVWQGAVFAIVLVLLLIALRSYTAQSRYVVAVGLLCAFFLTVSATFWQQLQDANSRLELSSIQMNSQPTNDTFVFNNNSEKVSQPGSENISAPLSNNQILVENQSGWLLTFKDYYDRHLPLLVTIWFLGVLFLQLRFLGQLAYVQRLKHYGTQLFPETWSNKIEELEGKLRIQKKVSYLTSIRIQTPMVIGWLKPVVLLPRQILNNLSETEIYAVLAHELAHIRREDFIVNLMQTFLCNIFFFHPGIWWMSNRIDDEREHCCDDLAVAATGPAISYAKTLISVSELRLRMQGNTPLAMALSGKRKKRERGGFTSRIRRLFMVSNSAGTYREGFATACILITTLFLGVIVTGSTVQTTDSLNQSNIDKTEISSTNEASNSNEFKQSKTNQSSEKQPLSSLNQIGDENDLSIPHPEKPAPPVHPDETRIDALVTACGEGDFEFVKTLVNAGIDVNGIGSEGFTPLMMAASENEAEIIEYLLKKGADVNQTHNGWTALMEAADEGSLSSMKLLLKAGADVNYYWRQNNPTAISMAASEGHLDCLKLLLEHGADINGIGKSMPPLHMAAEEDKRHIIDYLISKKVNIDKKDAGGHTALMHAASEGQEYIVEKLIKAGADTSIVDSDGYNAADYAEAEDEYETRDLLRDGTSESRGKSSDLRGKNSKMLGIHSESGKPIPEMHQLTLDGRIEKVQRMIENGADVNSRDEYGRTPLHLASYENHNIDMRILINLGADINAQDKQGRTPLMYAAADGKDDAVILLVSRRANVHIKDVEGMRAIDWARSGRDFKTLEFLSLITVEQTTQTNQNDTYQNHPINTQTNSPTPIRKYKIQKEQEKRIQKSKEKEVKKEYEKRETLHVAEDGLHLRQFDIKNKIPELLETVRNGSIDDCRKLLNKGLSPNSADDTGQTALMVAAMTNRIDIAKLLIERGGDVNKSSASGLTALHYAALENYDQMARLLLKHHAKIDATMRYSSTDGNYSNEPLVWEYIGATPLLIAVESKNIEVLSVLVSAGANKNHTLIRNEYRLNKDRVSYLSGGEVMGLDGGDFLKDVEVKISDETWTPYKQALHLNDQAILIYFPK